jgi:hypothetical protein
MECWNIGMMREKYIFRLIFYLFCIILKYKTVPGNLFSAAALAVSVYLPEGRHHSRCEQSEKK